MPRPRFQTLARAVLHAQTDERLVALARRGTEPAFDEFVRRYRPGLVAFAAAYGPPDPEDVVQESLLRAWTGLRDSTGEMHLKAWLYTIVRNRALNARRDERTYAPLPEDIDGVRQPAEIVLTSEELDRVVGAVATLPEAQRQALVRSALDGHTHEQIAASLGSTPGAVRQLIYRARLTVRHGVGLLVPLPLVALLTQLGAGTAGVAAGGAAATAGGAGGASLAAKAAVVAAIGAAAVGSGVAIERSGDGGGGGGQAQASDSGSPGQDDPAASAATESTAAPPVPAPVAGGGAQESTDDSGPGRSDDSRGGGSSGSDDSGGEGSGHEGGGSSGPGGGQSGSGGGQSGSGGGQGSSGPGGGDDPPEVPEPPEVFEPPEVEEDHSGPGGGTEAPEVEEDNSGPGGGEEPELEEDNSGSGSGGSGSG